jgi:hypothetical protein
MIPPKKERGRTRERAPSRLSRALSESPERLRDDDSSEVSKECSPSSARKRSRSRSRERDVDDRGYDTDEANSLRTRRYEKSPGQTVPRARSTVGGGMQADPAEENKASPSGEKVLLSRPRKEAVRAVVAVLLKKVAASSLPGMRDTRISNRWPWVTAIRTCENKSEMALTNMLRLVR